MRNQIEVRPILVAAAIAGDERGGSGHRPTVCAPFEPCGRILPVAVNLPVRSSIYADAHLVVRRPNDAIEPRSASSAATDADGAATLQGVDKGRPWLMQISRETGRFSLAIARPKKSLVAFGVGSASLLQ